MKNFFEVYIKMEKNGDVENENKACLNKKHRY